MRSRLYWLLTLLSATPLIGRAQSDLGQGAFQMGQSALGTSMMNNVLSNNVAAARGGKVSSTPTTYDYRPTPALEQQTVQRLVKQVEATSPTSAQTIATLFGPGKVDYEQAYRKLNDGTGLRENNLADIMAAYLLIGHLIVNDLRGDNPVSQSAAKWTSINLVPALANMSQLKQSGATAQVGEEFKLQAVLLQMGWAEASKNNTLAAYRQQTAAHFKQRFGIDFTRLKLTDRGLARK